jgi:hypothetical protein
VSNIDTNVPENKRKKYSNDALTVVYNFGYQYGWLGMGGNVKFSEDQ